MKKIHQATAILTMFLSAGAASAACTQANVVGDWTSYETYGGGGETGSEITCQLKIDAKGAIETPSSCKEYGTNLGSAKGSVILTNANRCAYKVTITQTVRREDFSLSDATLALNAFLHGAGVHSGLTFTFDMIKIK